MILAALRRERALRMLAVALPLTALIAWFFSGPLMRMVSLDESGRTSVIDSVADALPFLLFPTIQGLVFVIFFVPARQRVLELERGLPVTMRALVCSRVLATSAALLAPLAVCAAVLLVRLSGEAGQRYVAGGAALTALALVLAVLATFAWRPRALRLSQSEGTGATVTGLGLLLLPMWIAPTVVAIVYAAAIVVLTVRLVRSVPYAIPAEGEVTTTGAVRPWLPGSFSPLRRTLLASTLRPFTVITMVFVALGAGFVGRENLAFSLYFPLFCAYLVTSHGLAPLHGLDALPLARTRLLPYATLPMLLALSLGATLMCLVPLEYSSFEPVSHAVQLDRLSEETLDGRAEYGPHVVVPPKLWRFAAGDESTTVVAPWGERSEPLRHRLPGGFGAGFYNPYDVGETNTVRFLAWQLSRAFAASGERELTPEQVHERWFSEHAPSASISDVRFTYREDTPWGAPSQRKRVPAGIGLALFAAIVIWFAGASWALRPNVPAGSVSAWRRRRALRWITVALFSTLILVVFWTAIKDNALKYVVAARLHATLDAALGSSTPAWLVLDALLAGAGYAFLRYRIQRIELPPLPKFGWQKKEVSVF